MPTPKMTPAQHADKELALKAEIADFVTKLSEGEYRTKIEKAALSFKLQEKRAELQEHLAIGLSDLNLG